MGYSSLEPGEIRLLRLLSPSRSDAVHEDVPIHCELFKARLDQKPQYVALSYAWGDLDDTVPIFVDDTEVKVTRNLLIALEHIRDDHDDVPLWIDALCINQKNAEEKSEQVKQMDKIYKLAVRTIVWLGAQADGSDEAILYLDKAGAYVVRHGIYDDMIEMANIEGDEEGEKRLHSEAMVKERLSPLFAKAMEDLPNTFLFLTAVSNLLSRPYWNRIWILQEFVVSSELNIWCGKSKIAYNHFHGSILFFIMAHVHIVHQLYLRLSPVESLPLPPDLLVAYNQLTIFSKMNIGASRTIYIFGMRVGHQWSEGNPAEEGLTLANLLSKAHVNGRAKSSVDLDRIYALLGLASDSSQLGIVPNYNDSTKIEDVFTSTARAIIESGQVDLLSFSQTRLKKKVVPSWVPDWCAEVLRPCGRFPWFTSFSASGDALFEKANGQENICADEIKLRGCQVDYIEALKGPWTPGPEGIAGDKSDAVVQYLKEVLQLCEISNAKFKQTGTEVYSSSSYRDDAHVRVPIADQFQIGTGAIRRADKTCHQGHAEVLDENRRLRNIDWVKGHTPAKGGYYTMMGWQRYRRPFVSREGYVGLAPDEAQARDIIVVFLGAKFPYVLRKRRDGRYTFIGEAYVHGIMYGELMKTNPRVSDFILK